jgi:hypothetical protein
MVMPYHLHMPSYFLETFTEYPFATRFQETFPVIHEKAGKKKILLIFQLPYNQYPFRIFRHPETVIATLSYQPYNPVC